MLTGFKSLQKAAPKAKAAEMDKDPMLALLDQALLAALNDNEHRVYIDDRSHLVKFKLPQGLDLPDIKKALDAKVLVALESRTIGGEILSHRFAWASAPERTLEVLYEPLSRPRM